LRPALSLCFAALVAGELAGLFALLPREGLWAEGLSTQRRTLSAELGTLTAERRSRAGESATAAAPSAAPAASVLISERL